MKKFKKAILGVFILLSLCLLTAWSSTVEENESSNSIQLLAANASIEEGSKVNVEYYDMGQAYQVDNSPYYVSILSIGETGEVIFCIEPDVMMQDGVTYTATQSSSFTTSQLLRIAAATLVYQDSPSNEHYVAVQMYIWSVVGLTRTVNGLTYDEYWPELDTLISAKLSGEGLTTSTEETIEETFVVEFAQDNIMVDLNSSFSNADVNGVLTNENYELEISPMGPDGQGDDTSETARINDSTNSVTGTNQNIWPSKKTYTVTGGMMEETTEEDEFNISDILTSSYILEAGDSQKTFYINYDLTELVTTILSTSYIGDSFTTTLRTGSLSFTKVDEWLQNAGEGHSYMVWYAVQDEDGTAIDENGVRWSKYEVFVTESDWSSGVTQSIFTTDENGQFTISALPSGGSWDSGVAIGTYIIQEVDTTNGYQLNGKEYVFTVNYGSTTELTVTNHERIVELVINKYDVDEYDEDYHMSSTDLYLNGAEYTVWDISDVVADETGDIEDRLETNYFIKIGTSVDLYELLADVVDEIAAEHDGTIPIISAAEHCEKFEYDEDAGILTVYDTDTLELYFLNPSKSTDIWGSQTIYLVTNDDELCEGDTCTITGVQQFRATTGTDVVQLVDVQNHHLPLAYGWLTVYYDEELTKPYAYYQADEFGVIDFTTATVVFADGVEEDWDGDTIYYYQLIQEYHEENDYSDVALGDSLEGYHHSEAEHETNDQVDYNSGYVNLVTYTITGRELLYGKDAEKGELTIPNLHWGRTYLICESDTPSNYDLDEGVNACFIYTIDDEDYPEYVWTHSTYLGNYKVEGDLDVSKLDEWYDLDESGQISFLLYHAQLRVWTEDDDDGLYNEMLDNRNDYDLNYNNVAYCYYGYSYDYDTNLCVYDGEDLEEVTGTAYHEPVYTSSDEVYPVLGEPVYNEDGNNIYTVNSDGSINIENLHYGWYILVEYEEGASYELNTDYVLFYVGHDETEVIYFTNKNRTVSFEVYKMDSETGVMINGAEFTVWDISDTLDTDMWPTDYGEDGDLTDVDWSLVNSIYSIEELYFGVRLSDIDLYELFIDGTAFEDVVAGRPLYYVLSDYSTASITSNGTLYAEQTNYITIDVYGGGRSLYGTAGDIVVYQGEVWDPYADLYFYGDAEGTDQITVLSIQYTTENGEFTTDVLGTYTLIYTLTTDEHVTYRFEREVTVIEDDRHYCKYDTATDNYIWSDTGEVCTVLSLDDYISQEQEIVLLYDDTYDPEWDGTYIYTFSIFITLEDGELIADINATTNEDIDEDATYYSIDGVKVWVGESGHKYIQTVDPDNHNLPVPYQEVVIYYDEELKYPYRLYVSDENGMVDLTEDEYVLLADYPITQVDAFGNRYVVSAQKTEYVDATSGAILGYQWESIIYYLANNEAGLDLVDSIDVVYWENPVTGSVEEISLTQQDGRIELTNLKTDRTYLICETGLPEGYTYSELQDVCFVLDTSQTNYGYDDWGEKIYSVSGTLLGVTRYNTSRYLDVTVTKFNSSRTQLLNGAIFDVYDLTDEGEDANVIDNTIADMQLYEAEDGTLYYKPALGVTDKACDSIYYTYDDDVGACVLKDGFIMINTGDEVTDWYELLGIEVSNDNDSDDIASEENEGSIEEVLEEDGASKEVTDGIITDVDSIDLSVEGMYWIYYAIDGEEFYKILIVTDDEIEETIGYTELSTCYSYVTSDTPLSSMIAVDEYGNYLTDGEGGACYITYTAATVERTYLGRYVSGGIYISDDTAEYVDVATDSSMTNIVKRVYLEDGEAVILGLNDGYYYTRLSNSNDVTEHLVTQGEINILNVKYGSSLLIEEISAPSGYWFDYDDQYLIVEVTAEWGANVVYAERFNKAIDIPQLSVHSEDVVVGTTSISANVQEINYCYWQKED